MQGLGVAASESDQGSNALWPKWRIVGSSGIRAIAPVGFMGDAFERLAVLLHLHEVSGALVPFLIVAVGPLKLGASGNSAATEVISCVFGHEIDFLVQACDSPRLEIDRRMMWIW